MKLETTGREALEGITKSEAKLSVGPEVRGMGDRELLTTHTTSAALTSAGCQQSCSPGELGFLSGQEVLLLQEMGQFKMINIKGARSQTRMLC